MKYSATTGQFYSPTLRYTALPTDLITLTPEEHVAAVAALQAGGTLSVVGGKLTIQAANAGLLATQALNQAVSLKSIAIDTLAAAFIAAQVGTTPAFEQSTWAAQLAEAQAYTANSSAATPMLTAIATARSTTVAWLAAKIIAKSAAYNTLVAAVVGQRQAYHMQLSAAGDLATVDAIVINYTAPETPVVAAPTPAKSKRSATAS